MRQRNSKFEKGIRLFNIILFFAIISFGLVFLIISLEKTKEAPIENTRSLLEITKKDTMLSKEKRESENIIFFEKKGVEEDENKESIDPDLEYAIKLFETRVNKSVNKTFKKPFNFKSGNYCTVEFKLDTNDFKLSKCEGDSIFKRALSLAIKEITPIERFTYNKINLKNKKIKILISID
tara:strand:- start:5135 stop:5674 length:540 start_codon:yes stop_codon:yes gene_type:complete